MRLLNGPLRITINKQNKAVTQQRVQEFEATEIAYHMFRDQRMVDEEPIVLKRSRGCRQVAPRTW